MVARRHAGHPVVAPSPVGDQKAVEAPLVHQDLPEQVPVLTGVGTVDLVVGGHEAPGPPLLHRDLETGEVELPQGALVHHTVRVHAQGLLAVDGEVLGAGGDAVGLDAPDIGRRQLAGQVGVLRVVLEVPPALGGAFQVQPRPQQHADSQGTGLLPDQPAHGLHQLRVPGAGQGGGDGPAGGGQAGVEPQVVRRPGLLAHAAGSVGEEDGGDAQLGDGLGGELGAAAEQGAFLLQGHLRHHFLCVQPPSSFLESHLD